ncbi:homologous-pairing protein 2 homolog isoform X2 [Strix uralensis]|uniref:homologous-pairing protein 2 homolog isoform X2 n=1 Tax=Strix uralensis TaxID=36305 RepID=UPI003DA78387
MVAAPSHPPPAPSALRPSLRPAGPAGTGERAEPAPPPAPASRPSAPPPPATRRPRPLPPSDWLGRRRAGSAPSPVAGSGAGRAPAEDEQRPRGPRGGRRRRRCPVAVPAGAEPALQRPGRLREPAAGARAGQGGRGEGAGAAGAAGPRPREGLREAEDLLCRPELKDLSSSMTTPEMARELEELRKDCATYTEKLERMKSATNHVTPEEKEKVCSEQKLYCKEWRRRKRMLGEQPPFKRSFLPLLWG